MKLKLTARFVLTLLVVGLVPLSVLAYFNLRSTAAIAEDASEQLQSLAVSTLDTIERNLFERYGDVQAFATNRVLQEFLRTADQPQSPAEANSENVPPAPPSTPAGLNEEGRQAITQAINNYILLYGIYSLGMVTNAEGRIIAVNTVDAKDQSIPTSPLIGRNVASTPWFLAAKQGDFTKSDTLSGTVVEDVSRDPMAVEIFGPETLTIAYSAPIFDEDGTFLGVWRNLADLALVEDIMKATWQSLADKDMPAAELALVARDGTLLVEIDPASRNGDFERDSSIILELNLKDLGVASALRAIQGETGYDRDFHQRKQTWLAAGFAHSAGALGYPGLGWSLLVRAPEAQLLADVRAADRLTYGILVVSTLALIVVAILVARSLTKPILACVRAVEALAAGDLTSQLNLKRSDEIGTLAESVDRCLENLRQLVGELKTSSASLSSAATSLSETAHSQAAGAEETNVQASTVAAAGVELAATANDMSASANQIGQSTTAVAAAIEEMSASIREISTNCARESESAGRAEQQTQATQTAMDELSRAAEEIGRIVEIIGGIASQTNLLALNATIEAANAGEAGKGFAVVASEVKELARQSATATEDIRQRIDLIQQATRTSGESLEGVAMVIQEVHHISSTIAAAVEEQSATISEIASSVQSVNSSTNALGASVTETAATAEDVSRNIQGVSDAAADAARGASTLTSNAQNLERISDSLTEVVSRFRLNP